VRVYSKNEHSRNSQTTRKLKRRNPGSIRHTAPGLVRGVTIPHRPGSRLHMCIPMKVDHRFRGCFPHPPSEEWISERLSVQEGGESVNPRFNSFP
jgi:hypothetical protein